MTEAVVFETPGLLDLRAITTFGINVKKRDNPIGFFGTGLKYAIAVLVREGISVTIYVGPKEYVFYKKDGDFRGKTFDFVMCKQRNSLLGSWTAKKMPFTTEFGKNWELWQAFREIESNTRDEGGSTYVRDLSVLWAEGDSTWGPKADTTRIVVGGEAFYKVWEDRDKIFLPEALTIPQGYDVNIQVFKRPSSAVYYRGLKVMELQADKPSLYTYNILHDTQLTEDRTVKYDWDVRDKIMQYICCKCTDSQIISDIVTASEKDTWEGSFPFDQLWRDPSELFMSIIRKKKQRAERLTLGSSYRTVPLHSRVDRLWESKQPVEKPKDPFELANDIDPGQATLELSQWLMTFSEMFNYGGSSADDAFTVAKEIIAKSNPNIGKPRRELASNEDVPF